MADYTGYIDTHVPLATSDGDAAGRAMDQVRNVFVGDELDWVDMNDPLITEA